MKFIFTILFAFTIFYSFNLAALSKKEALYQTGKPLEEWSKDAGFNSGWISSCTGGNGSKIANDIRKKVAKLSWPDFKLFNVGKSTWDQNNYVAGKCSESNFNNVKQGLYNYVDQLEYLVNQKIGVTKENCSDNLDNLTDKQLIECGISEGWVDEETMTINLDKIDEKDSNLSADFPIEEELKKLKKLYDSGLITKEVYEKKQLEILED